MVLKGSIKMLSKLKFCSLNVHKSSTMSYVAHIMMNHRLNYVNSEHADSIQ